MPLLAAAAQIADSLTPIANAPTTSEGATRDGRSRRLDIHTSSSIVYCPWPRFMGLHPARLSLCAPSAVRGTSGNATMFVPGGAGTTPRPGV
jgi:hypothetical protein